MNDFALITIAFGLLITAILTALKDLILAHVSHIKARRARP